MNLINSTYQLFTPSLVHQHCREPYGRPEDLLLPPLAAGPLNGSQGLCQRCHRGWTSDGQELHQDLQELRGQVHAEVRLRGQQRVPTGRRRIKHLLPARKLRHKFPFGAHHRQQFRVLLRGRTTRTIGRRLPISLPGVQRGLEANPPFKSSYYL